MHNSQLDHLIDGAAQRSVRSKPHLAFSGILIRSLVASLRLLNTQLDALVSSAAPQLSTDCRDIYLGSIIISD
jgi:hypothetical protein